MSDQHWWPNQPNLFELMTTSQEWWPADYGHYGPPAAAITVVGDRYPEPMQRMIDR
jgi:hypothetical protein